MGFFNDYFHSSASERKGAIVLLIIILAIVFIYIFNANKEVKIRTSIQYNPPPSDDNKYTSLNKQETHGLFDPNKAGIITWQKFGFTQEQAKSIIKFKNLIGGFKKPKDVLSSYVIDSTMYGKIAPFIRISKTTNNSNSIKKIKGNQINTNAILLLKSSTPLYDDFKNIKDLYYKKKQNLYYYFTYIGLENSVYNNLLKTIKSLGYDSAVITKIDTAYLYKIDKKKYPEIETLKFIDINSADTSTFMKLYGIGSVLSNRIVEYRNKLGGFINKNQLLEIYGLEHSLYKNIENKLILSDTKINQININIANRKTLYNHPYINWNVANAITQYRFQHGEFTSVDKIKAIHLVDADLYLKIASYLIVK